MSVVLITGGGKRIGRELALSFAVKGWDVLIHYNNSFDDAQKTKREIIDKGRYAEIYQADLKEYAQILNMFDKIAFNKVIPDVLINNAAIFPSRTTIENISIKQWEEVLKVNLSSPFLMSKEFAKIVTKQARIINISSLGGINIWKDRIDYNVSKSALIQLTKVLARALAPQISVNVVCPGYIDLSEHKSKNENKEKMSLQKIPMNRYGTVEDVFEAVYFFSSCSQFITGQVLIVDGGQSLIH